MTIDMLLLEMIKRISYAVILGLVISRLKLFDRLMINKLSRFDRIIFTVIFSSIAIRHLRRHSDSGRACQLPHDRHHGGRSHRRPVPRHVRRHRIGSAPLFLRRLYGSRLCYLVHYGRDCGRSFSKIL